jgi:hypothetical protein
MRPGRNERFLRLDAPVRRERVDYLDEAGTRPGLSRCWKVDPRPTNLQDYRASGHPSRSALLASGLARARSRDMGMRGRGTHPPTGMGDGRQLRRHASRSARCSGYRHPFGFSDLALSSPRAAQGDYFLWADTRRYGARMSGASRFRVSELRVPLSTARPASPPCRHSAVRRYARDAASARRGRRLCYRS